jgi:hypothetical protein
LSFFDALPVGLGKKALLHQGLEQLHASLKISSGQWLMVSGELPLTTDH